MKQSVFSKSIVIITGAGSGMGRQMSLQAAQRGGFVIGVDINENTLHESASIMAAKGLAIQTHQLDVADAPAVQNFAAQILPALNNRKLILINNAGVGLGSGNFNDTALSDFEWLININLWGVIRMTKAFYSYMMERNEGHIVNISSIFGLGGIMFQSAYCTAKFGVRGFTESLRMELLGTNIHTTTVHPGGIKTNIARNARHVGNVITLEAREHGTKQFEDNVKTTAEEAARLILDAVERRKERLVIGADGKSVDFITRLLPVAYSRILKNRIEKVFTNPYVEKK